MTVDHETQGQVLNPNQQPVQTRKTEIREAFEYLSGKSALFRVRIA